MQLARKGLAGSRSVLLSAPKLGPREVSGKRWGLEAGLLGARPRSLPRSSAMRVQKRAALATRAVFYHAVNSPRYCSRAKTGGRLFVWKQNYMKI